MILGFVINVVNKFWRGLGISAQIKVLVCFYIWVYMQIVHVCVCVHAHRPIRVSCADVLLNCLNNC